jgi:gluconokinase
MLSYDNPILITGNGAAPSSVTTVDMTANGVHNPGRIPGAHSAAAPATTNGSVSTTLTVQEGKMTKPHHIFLVTGPAGVGKSSVAAYLSSALNFPYIEGDEFHPAANVEKMSNGIPLTDTDRWDWLTALREESLRMIRSGSEGVVLTCSALKEKYRDVIRVAGYFDHSLSIHFIYLSASEELLLERVRQRQNHYMGANMVHSQFDILEPPRPNEKDVISIDVTRSLAEVQRDALTKAIEIMTKGPTPKAVQ